MSTRERKKNEIFIGQKIDDGSIHRFIWNAGNIVSHWHTYRCSLYKRRKQVERGKMCASVFTSNRSSKKKHFPLFCTYFLLQTLTAFTCAWPASLRFTLLRFALLYLYIILSHKFEMLGIVYRMSCVVLLLDIRAFKFCYVHRILPED